ncbi:glycoside hydrolase family 6 protein [Actinacidiphila guanduensis]|uniref:Glucanase n=1 Tax=Actinacidiphila guanduensis TaxID=310781 RepID=A0A1H0F1G8_9ACTN|nr:glycoside hydrolase family 6 protein [Actinacidiphila guanduensis]SDN88508.1 cellulose 1,4-beta-cellobiosidase [Actinacidiphila guanduensis]
MAVPKLRRRTAALSAGALVVASGAVAAALSTTTAEAATAGCSVNYSISTQWDSGFTASVTVTNTGNALTSWKLGWSFAGNQKVTQGWNAAISQSGAAVTASSLSYNGTVASGGTFNFGFNGSYSGTNAVPTSFTLNGVACGGGSTTGGSTTGGNTTGGSTTGGSTTGGSTTGGSTTGGSTTGGSTTGGSTTGGTTPPPSGGSRVDNPYVGAKGYVNPEWSAEAAGDGGSAIANQSTAVWLDRIAAINGVNGGMGLKDHLDEAVAQSNGQPLTVEFVIYDLPGRDCAALASNGELGPNDLATYESSYIDPIASIMSDPAYANLRIVNVIEPDSLPNIVTNANGQAGGTDACATMKANGNYEKGVGYALAKLGALPNTYNYIDAGHHAWLGWDSNFVPAAQEFLKAATTSGATVHDVQGFITNTANYSPTVEPNFKVTDTVNGTTVRQSKWVDWNNYVDEQSYAVALRNELVSVGFDSNIGMLIDTGRNGWGGSARPTGPGATTSVDTYVDGGRIDRRVHAGNWCNQSGAGIGARPTAAPAAGVDAYVWIKPPGESDGASQPIDNNEGKGFDQMCDPNYGGNARNGNNPTGALPNSPLAGHWFSAEFHQLVQNAYPPLS